MGKLFDELQKEDWLHRGGASYTSRAKLSLNKHHGTSAVSSAIVPIGKTERISDDRGLQLARFTTRRVVQAMNTTGKPVNVLFTKDFKNFTDRESIVVSTEPLDIKIPFPSYNHRLDVVIGCGVHEMAHVLFTPDDIMFYGQEEKSKKVKAVKEYIRNILEDERIENLVNQTFPGYSGYISAVKDYVFRYRVEHLKSEIAKTSAADVQELLDLMNSILALVRYPSMCTEELTDKFEPELREVIDILTPYPETPPELMKAASAIYDILRRYIKDNELGEGEDAATPPQQKQAKKGEEPQKVIVMPGSGGQPLTEEEAAELMNAIFEYIKGEDITETKEELENSKTTHQELVDLDIGEIQNNEKAGEEDFQEEQVIDNITIHKPLKASQLMCKFIDKSKDIDLDEYGEVVDEVAAFAPTLRSNMKKFNRNRTEVYRGLMEGTFDEDELIPAKMGSKTVFKQEAKIHNTGATVVLLSDESGSMSDEVDKLRQIAVTFERALDGVNEIDFYAYGHTTGNGDIGSPDSGYDRDATLIHTYYEGKKRGKRGCLAKMDSYAGNRDGHALLQVANRVRKFTSKPIVMFLVSDGEPSASVPEGYTPITYTKACADELEKYHNIQIIHIASDPSVQSELMFNKYIKFEDMGQLVSGIGGILTKAIRKFQTPQIKFE